MDSFKTSTLNVNGARDGGKRAKVMELVRQKGLDVVLLQETHSDVNNSADWVKEWEGLAVLSHHTSMSGGVAVLFAKSFIPCSYDVEEVVPGRLLKVRACFENEVFVFICVYAPTVGTERLAFLDTLHRVVQNTDVNDLLVLGGDFNCTAADMDRNHMEPHPASRRRLCELVEANELSDVWRTLHAEQRQYTWTHFKDRMLSLARLDRLYVFKHHCSVVSRCFIYPVGFTDHCMVQCAFRKPRVKPRSAYWHFNTALLDDANFRESFMFFWDTFRLQRPSFSSVLEWWDMAKIQTRVFCQQYTLNVTRDIARSLKALEMEIVELQNLGATTGNREHIKTLKSKTATLADLLGARVQGALVRSRFQSASEMDAPSKFFFGLEQKNGQKRFMHAVRTESGDLLSEPAEIRKRTVGFFSKLYTSEQSGTLELEESFLHGLPKLPRRSAEMLDRALSLDELYTALQGMENGRAPGIDGLPVEFYRSFWSVLGQDVLDVLRASLVEGKLPLSCRRAVLTLLPKKGDLTDLKNWRPVSLLCTDYKLLSKSLAARLGKVMGQVIHLDQTYCVPGRSIFDNIHLIRAILDVSRLLGLRTGLLFLDQEKAFDRVEHGYLWKVLENLGFSSCFIAMIKVLYSDIESVLKVNGGLCAPFQVHRGIRQGCGLSGFMYSLAIEPLLCKIREVVSGFRIPDCSTSFCVSAYADDVVVMVGSQTEVDVLSGILKDFQVLSSAKVNWAKSEAFLVGEWRGEEPRLPDGLHWKRGGFKYLGVYLGDGDFMKKNWEDVLERIKGRLMKWQWLVPKMSYRGRVLIINNLAASSLWHKLACVDPPPNLLADIQAMLVDFFWDRLHWLPQGVLYLPKDEGGQGLVHLASRTAVFRLQFIERLLTGPESVVWRVPVSRVLQTVEGLGLDRALFLSDTRTLDFGGLPVFYKGLFKIWELFILQRESCSSLYWLLEEPVVHSARLDITSQTSHNLSRLLIAAGVTKLGQLVGLAGPELTNTESFAAQLGLRSLRVARQILHKLSSALTGDERLLMKGCAAGVSTGPAEGDPFPRCTISPNLGDCGGPLLKCTGEAGMVLGAASPKLLYRACVKAINRRRLDGRADTPWRRELGLHGDTKPEWRVLYKPPLTKKAADLQWRVLHGIVSVNSFISVLNPGVSHECPFCLDRETVFHAFMRCFRLRPLFRVLQNVFTGFSLVFTPQAFIIGTAYVRSQRSKCQLLNFILGQAKLAIYVSRKNKMSQSSDHDAIQVFTRLVRARVKVDFNYYRSMKDLDSFKLVWCSEDVVCSVEEDELVFAPDFI
ncbi:hypothetical protein NFI96_004370 [Prochilodus magdalenae]|nr:hypothetical protein NFI96_004370 [Prochilodus magdalenae]